MDTSQTDSTELPAPSAAALGQAGRFRDFAFLVIFLSCFYFSFGTYRNWHYKIESDGKYYYQYLVSAYYDHDFDFTNNYATPAYPWMRTAIDQHQFAVLTSPITGRPSNLFTMGPAILWLPFFILARAIAHLLGALGLNVDTNPWGQYFQYTVMFSAVVYTSLAMHFLYRLLARHFGHLPSLLATWLLLTATGVFYYTVFEASMSHVYDLFAFVLFLFLLQRAWHYGHPGFYVGTAAAGALHVLVRTQNIGTLFLFSSALGVLTLRFPRPRGQSVRLLAIYLATLIVGLLPIPLLNTYLYGAPFVIPQGSTFLQWTSPKIAEVLFSARNGLFSHYPALLLGLAGFLSFLFLFIKSGDRDEAIFLVSLLAALMFQVYVGSIVTDWWGGHAFGQRRLLSSLPLFGYGFAWLIHRIRKPHPRLTALSIAAFSVAGLYLTFIHVFLWSYEEPHKILAWMFLYAPAAISNSPLVQQLIEVWRIQGLPRFLHLG